jgi:hypothetical protein
MKTLALYLAVALTMFAYACDSPPEDATPKESAFSTGAYCNSSSDTFCMNQSPINIGSYSCGGVTYTAVIYMDTQNATNPIFGPVSWTEAWQTVPAGFGYASNLIFLQFARTPGQVLNLPMTQGSGLLYLSTGVIGRMTRYNLSGALVSDVPISLPAGNFQYYPADPQNKHGRWAAWIAAPNVPASGVCGNMAFSWAS